MIKTFEERAELMLDMLTDTRLALTQKEVLANIYHWMFYEINLRIMIKATRRVKKHARWLDDNKDCYILRVEMKDL